MIASLILLQFIAHLMSDFIFQSHNWSVKKSENFITKYHFYHILVVFGFSYIVSFDFGFWYCALLLALLHLIIDGLKSFLQLKTKRFNYFFVDQLSHIIILISISVLYHTSHGIHFIIEIPIGAVLIIASFILVAKPTNIFIKNIFTLFSIEIPDSPKHDNIDETDFRQIDASLPNAGKLIGIMERLLVLSLILVGQFSAVGLIIAAKSILRFKSTQKNEYVLVGTLLSFGIAVIIGILTSKYYTILT